MIRAALAAIALAGCYSPELARCTVQCVGDQPCPGGLACGTDGFCHAEGEQADCPVPLFEVRVRASGTGMNLVRGPNQLMCVGECTVMVERGRHRFEAIPGMDSRLVGWTIGDDPLACGPLEECFVDVTSDLTIEAMFDLGQSLIIRLSGDGDGSVRGAVEGDPAQSFVCRRGDVECVKRFPRGTTVTLTQASVPPSVADVSWNGSCTGPSEETCTVMLDNNPATVLMGYDVIYLTMLPFPSAGGSITYTGLDSNLSCPPDCTIRLMPSAPPPHTFEAVPNSGSGYLFGRWITSPMLPSCSTATTCQTIFPLDGDTLVIAAFDGSPTLTTVVTGGQVLAVGELSGTPLVCGPQPINGFCTQQFLPGEMVTIVAPDLPGTAFDHWEGADAAACQAPDVSPCVLTLTSDTIITARFRFDVTVQVASEGSVMFDPPGMSPCGPGTVMCTERYLEGTTVTVTPAPQPAFKFAGWEGCPSGNQGQAPCTFTIDRPALLKTKWLPL